MRQRLLSQVVTELPLRRIEIVCTVRHGDRVIQRREVRMSRESGILLQLRPALAVPAGPLIQQSVEETVRSMPGVDDVETELTWDPPWTPDKMSDDAKFILGFG